MLYIARMGLADGGSPERVAKIVGLAMGAATGMTFASRFREAALVALFTSMVAAVVYGTLSEVSEVPDLSLAALAVFGMGVWTLALFVFDRRYS